MRPFTTSGAAITLLLALATAAAAQDASLVARATDADGGAVVGAPGVLIHIGSGSTAVFEIEKRNLTRSLSAYWQSSLGSRQLYPGEPFNVMATVRLRTN